MSIETGITLPHDQKVFLKGLFTTVKLKDGLHLVVGCWSFGSVKLGIKSFLSSCKRLIKLVGRPSREEVWTYIKTGSLGIIIIGVIGFIVKLISSMLQASPSS